MPALELNTLIDLICEIADNCDDLQFQHERFRSELTELLLDLYNKRILLY